MNTKAEVAEVNTIATEFRKLRAQFEVVQAEAQSLKLARDEHEELAQLFSRTDEGLDEIDQYLTE